MHNIKDIKSNLEVFIKSISKRNFKIDEKGFWYCENEEGHCFDLFLCKEIIKILRKENINNIVDFGCGPGKYVASILEEGFECIGYDGNPNTPNYTNGICGVLDLSEDFTLDAKFDCVISLEVGEHIPKEYESVFLDNINGKIHVAIIMLHYLNKLWVYVTNQSNLPPS